MTDESQQLAPVHRISPRRRWSLRQWPLTVVLIALGGSLLLIATDHFRRGSVGLAASVMLAFFLRLLLPESDAGLLAVRSKRVDVIVLGVLAIGLTVFAFWVPAPN